MRVRPVGLVNRALSGFARSTRRTRRSAAAGLRLGSGPSSDPKGALSRCARALSPEAVERRDRMVRTGSGPSPDPDVIVPPHTPLLRVLRAKLPSDQRTHHYRPRPDEKTDETLPTERPYTPDRRTRPAPTSPAGIDANTTARARALAQV